MDDDYKLKPCPFCGGKAKLLLKSFDIFNAGAYIMCEKCGARTILVTRKPSNKKAVELWNRRVDNE